jgi:hypothetical protein
MQHFPQAPDKGGEGFMLARLGTWMRFFRRPVVESFDLTGARGAEGRASPQIDPARGQGRIHVEREGENIAGVGRSTRIARGERLTASDVEALDRRAEGCSSFSKGDMRLTLLPKDGAISCERAAARLESPLLARPVDMILRRQGDQLTGSAILDDSRRVEVLIQNHVEVEIFAPDRTRSTYALLSAEDEHSGMDRLRSIPLQDRSAASIARALIGDLATVKREELWGSQNTIPRPVIGAREHAKTREIELPVLGVEDLREITRALRDWARQERPDIRKLRIVELTPRRGEGEEVRVYAQVDLGRDRGRIAERKEQIVREAHALAAAYLDYDETLRTKGDQRAVDAKQRRFWDMGGEMRVESVADLIAPAIVLEARVERMRAWAHPVSENDPSMCARIARRLRALAERENAADVPAPVSLVHGMYGAWERAKSRYLPSNHEMTEMEKLISEVESYLDRVDLRFGLPASVVYAGASEEDRGRDLLGSVLLSDLRRFAQIARDEASFIDAEHAGVRSALAALTRAAERIGSHGLAHGLRMESYRADRIRSAVTSGRLDVSRYLERKKSNDRHDGMPKILEDDLREMTRELNEIEVGLSLIDRAAG